jgi:methyltransferase-like protein
MKKTFIIGFILLGAVAKGELGTDIKQNQIILDNIKAENIQLRGEIKKLSQILDKLEINLVREIKFEDLGIDIRRDMESFTLKISDEDLSQGGYNKVLDSFIDIIKYDSKDPVTFAGNKKNVEFLRSYFTAKGIAPTRIILEIKNNDDLIPDKEGIEIVETKIILKKKED